MWKTASNSYCSVLFSLFIYLTIVFILILDRTAVNELNNKYKYCLILCKQLSKQEELVTRDEMKGVPLSADKLLYLHAVELCLNAASLEFFGKVQEVRNV